MTDLIRQQLTEEERAELGRINDERDTLFERIADAQKEEGGEEENNEALAELEAEARERIERFSAIYNTAVDRVLEKYTAAELFDIIAGQIEKQTPELFEARNARAIESYNELRDEFLRKQQGDRREKWAAFYDDQIKGILATNENTRANYRQFIFRAVEEDLAILEKKSPDHAKRIDGLIYRKAAKCYATEKQYRKRSTEKVQPGDLEKPYPSTASGKFATRIKSALYADGSGGLQRYAQALEGRQHKAAEVQYTRDQHGLEWKVLTEDTKDGKIGIQLPDKNKNSAATKHLSYLFTKIVHKLLDETGTPYEETISYPLQEYIDCQMYANIDKARADFWAAGDYLTAARFSYNDGKRANFGFIPMFQTWKLENGQCVIKLNSEFPYWDELTRYYSYLVPFHFALSNKTQRLDDIINNRASMNRAKIREAGRFEIKIQTVAEELNLPPLKDENGKRHPRHNEEIREPLLNCVAEFNEAEAKELKAKKAALIKEGKDAEAAALKQEIKLKISKPNAAIDEFLAGSLIVTFSGQIRELYSTQTEAEKEQARENAKRAAKKKKASGRGKA